MKNLILKERIRDLFQLYPSYSKKLYSYEKELKCDSDLPDELIINENYVYYNVCHLVNTSALILPPFRELFYENYINDHDEDEKNSQLIEYCKSFIIAENLNV